MKITHLEFLAREPRGTIGRILAFGTTVRFTSLLVITSKANSVRANHYHTKDIHYCYLVTGSFRYREQDIVSGKPKGKIREHLIKPGDIVRTEPMTLHRMEFLKDSVMIVATTELRDRESYERGTVRMELKE